MSSTAAVLDAFPILREESPASIDELVEVVKRTAASAEPMSPVGGGSQVHLGNAHRSAPVVIHTGGISGIVEYEPANLTVSVLAGTRLEELQGVLRSRQQFLPLDPPAAEVATLGGIVACNTSGPLRFRYGTVKDMLLGIRIVHADGTRTKAGGKLVKNVTGYDMCRLYTGSLGTLGIVTELTFKVQPVPESSATVLAAYRSLDSLLEAQQGCLRAELLPDALEGWNAAAFAPLAPGTVVTPWIMMIRFGEVKPAVAWQVARLLGVIARSGGEVIDVKEGEASEKFWQSAASLRETAGAPVQAHVKCAVLHRAAARTARELEKLSARLGGRISVYCHAGTGILYGRFSWSEAGPAPLELRQGLAELRQHCISAGGHAVIERASPAVKEGIDAWGYDAPAVEIMRKIKREFDPKGLLNAGRFVGGI